jgi:predicted RNA-binding Zn ribbon-like protein
MQVSTADLEAEKLLLELLNTTPVVHGEDIDELGDDPTAREWLKAHGGSGSDEELALIREIRPLLQSIVRGQASPILLAPYFKSVSYRAFATEEGLRWTLETAENARLAIRAVLAWDHLHTSSPGRLRACANSECRLFLIDRSKANNARWCSMTACGNRMKARRHYQRQRETRG